MIRTLEGLGVFADPLSISAGEERKTRSAEQNPETVDTLAPVPLCPGSALTGFYKGTDPVCWRPVPVSAFSPAVRFRPPDNKGGVFFFLLGSPVKWLLSHCSLVTLHCNSAHPCLEETVARQEEALIAQAISSPFV